MIQPRNLDQARRLYPDCDFYITGEANGLVTLQIVEAPPSQFGAETPPQTATWSAMTEAGCWALAFPPTEAEEVEAGTYMPAEGTAARAELAAAVPDDLPEVEPDPGTGGLFD